MIETNLQKELSYYAPALALDTLFPRTLRRTLRKILFFTAFVLAIFGLGVRGLSSTILVFGSIDTLLSLMPYAKIAFGFVLITGPLWLALFALESFYNTRYFRGSIARLVGDSAAVAGLEAGVTFEVARIVRRRPNDVLRGLVVSPLGRELSMRLGIGAEALEAFVGAERTMITSRDIVVPEAGLLSFSGIAVFLFKHDRAFADFLFQNGVREEIYTGAVRFVARVLERRKYQERWWSRKRLFGVTPLASDWSYGGAWILERFARSAESTSVFSGLALAESTDTYAREQVVALTTTLSRAQEANAILVGEEGVGKRDVLVALERAIRDEKVPPELSGKRVLVLDDDAFTAVFNTKALFEQNMIKLLSEAERAGNIILAIVDLPGFVISAEALGADVGSLLDPYLASSDLHVVATAHPSGFHSVIETRQTFPKRFEKIAILNPEAESIIAILEDVISGYEKRYGVFFTYAAIHAVAVDADRYVPGGVMPDKAIDLLVEVLPIARTAGEWIITKEFIDNYVAGKTGVPIGTVSAEEKETLLHLEEILHKRVIGQDEAINAIANAMRRARAGIQNPKRPIGSFLFLGPTGVGKTETTKALTEVFFGDESKMLRIDMSEYNTDNALERLIGGSAGESGGGPGDLSVILKDHPYGVLLLDEFEKTTPNVKDLFLQILDEGVFTNARGEKIGARNTIIIATSNAGSDLIFKYGEEGGSLGEKKDEIVDAVIKAHIFKPELLNRLDGVVFFHPLSREHLRDIAKIMLERLKKRIREQSYELIVNDVLVDLLVSEGYDPQFGARPMQRVVQDRVEKQLAQKILEGSLKPGASIEFTKSDFADTMSGNIREPV